jgi:hypothetical protein
MSTFHWSLVDFDDEPPKTRPPALTARQELMRYAPVPPSAVAEIHEAVAEWAAGKGGGLSHEPKKRGRPRKRPAEDA